MFPEHSEQQTKNPSKNTGDHFLLQEFFILIFLKGTGDKAKRSPQEQKSIIKLKLLKWLYPLYPFRIYQLYLFNFKIKERDCYFSYFTFLIIKA